MTVTLLDEEFHHLVHVLRGKVGQHVELFDGQGASAEAVVESFRSGMRSCRLFRTIHRDPPPGFPWCWGWPARKETG